MIDKEIQESVTRLKAYAECFRMKTRCTTPYKECNSELCDSCNLLYAQGTVAEHLKDIETAIRVLEKEPCEYKSKSNSILDKIKAEIKRLAPTPTAIDVVDGNPVKDAIWEILIDVENIIDKYMFLKPTTTDVAKEEPVVEEPVEEEVWETLIKEYLTGISFDFGNKEMDCMSKPQWIPVSERLPKDEGYYLVTLDCRIDGVSVTFLWFHGNNTGWESCAYSVIAWMPLPEPYTESEE